MDFNPEGLYNNGPVWCLAGDHTALRNRVEGQPQVSRAFMTVDSESHGVNKGRMGFAAGPCFTMTSKYVGDAWQISDDHEIRTAVADVLRNLGRFMDQSRVVKIEKFVDPEDNGLSVWLRVSCSVEDTPKVHDAIDRFYTEYWWDRQETAPIGILVGVGA